MKIKKLVDRGNQESHQLCENQENRKNQQDFVQDEELTFQRCLFGKVSTTSDVYNAKVRSIYTRPNE